MARVSFEFKKGDLFWVSLVVVLLCVGFGVAYNSGADPSVMGHSAEELAGRIETGKFSRTLTAEGWTLHTGTGEREYVERVSFSEPFDSPPEVSVSLNYIDSFKDYNTRFVVTTMNINETGFDIKYWTHADSIIYAMGASWIAVGNNGAGYSGTPTLSPPSIEWGDCERGSGSYVDYYEACEFRICNDAGCSDWQTGDKRMVTPWGPYW